MPNKKKSNKKYQKKSAKTYPKNIINKKNKRKKIFNDSNIISLEQISSNEKSKENKNLIKSEDVLINDKQIELGKNENNSNTTKFNTNKQDINNKNNCLDKDEFNQYIKIILKELEKDKNNLNELEENEY